MDLGQPTTSSEARGWKDFALRHFSMTYSITLKLYRKVFFNKNLETKITKEMANNLDQLAKMVIWSFINWENSKWLLKKLGTNLIEHSSSILNSNFISAINISQRKDFMSLQNFWNFVKFWEFLILHFFMIFITDSSKFRKSFRVKKWVFAKVLKMDKKFFEPLASLEVVDWLKFLRPLASLDVLGWQKSLKPLASLEVIGWPKW